MTETEKYNGWSNRETWAVALHINNDQGWQESVLESLREASHDVNDRNEKLTSIYGRGASGLMGGAAYHAGEIIRENVEDVLDPANHDGYPAPGGGVRLTEGQWLAIQDIGSLWRVDWTELGASFLEDLSED